MKLGNGDVSFRLGSITPSKVYVGSTEVWSDVVAVVPDAIISIGATASETTESAAEITWSDPFDGGAAIAGYNVYISEDSGMTWTLHDNAGGSPYELVIPYRGGSNWLVDVRAVNSAGEAPTALLYGNATLSDSAPGELTITNVTQQAGADLYVEWSGPAHGVTPAISEYEVEYTPASGSPGTSTTTNLGYYTLDRNQIDIGVEFGFRVRASNSIGYGPWSAVFYKTAADVPNSPTQSAGAAMSEQGAVDLSLAAADANGSPLLSYDVQASLDDTFSSLVADETYTDIPEMGGSWTKTIPGLAGGVLHYFRVRFTNAAGNGEWSSSFSAYASNSQPAQVTGFSVTPNYSGAGSSVYEWEFAWNEPSSGGSTITGYEIEESSTAENFSGATVVYPSPGTAYTATANDRDQNRYFRIRAVNPIGNGAWSEVQTSYYDTPTAPDAPTIDSAVWDGTQTTVSFTPGDNGNSSVTSDTFYFGGTPTSPDSTGANTASFNADFRGVDVEMSQTNEIGEGPTSSPFTVVGIPDTPTINAAYWNGTDTIVEYTDGSDGGSAITGHTFRFYGSETAPSSDSSGVATFAGNNWTGYEVDVAATNAYGTSAYSSTFSVTDNS